MPIQQEHTKAFIIPNSFEYAMLLSCGGMLLLLSYYCTANSFPITDIPANSESCTVQPLGTQEERQVYEQSSTSTCSIISMN
uniref:Uncharacterized protein n=1 Tax=Pyxicephalus adspersus TaxID=30357 RepID=A0AAV2ZU11_PYXAD|nr:TPA: hypothetical protein GDO54_002869 [Pyxicephalus adspersus]